MSIRVRVVLCADFREIVGKREIFEEVNSNSTLRHILDKLAEKYGKDFKQIINPRTGVVSVGFLVSVNGRNVRDVNVTLNNDDVVIITIPVGGG
jgi:MoaD family protein